MALTFTTGTFGPRTDVSYIDIGTDALILEASLTELDKIHLEAALAEDNLSDYAMPNGQQNADEYFTPLTRAAADITAQYQAAVYRSQIPATFADHEDRIATLEAGSGT